MPARAETREGSQEMADTTTGTTSQGSIDTTGEDQGAAQSTMEELQNQVTKLQAERDKAVEESRKWEKRSKSNAEKARAYDELAAKSMTDKERAEAALKQAEEAKAELEQFRAEAQRARDAAEIAEAYGLPASLLTESDREAMEAQAKSILAFAKNQPTAPVFTADGGQPGQPRQSPVAGLADWLRKIDH